MFLLKPVFPGAMNILIRSGGKELANCSSFNASSGARSVSIASMTSLTIAGILGMIDGVFIFFIMVSMNVCCRLTLPMSPNGSCLNLT